ncbi:MAG: hypothetical protein HYT88_06565 [Candidatus Omnitrophica bacterium]|nr:hypothetical protein [Candidatus Omnitrophota bacterium]MBI2173918.1 hypothetical protein [Candidatus Omnitrophota bacterium]MBI3010080.1 hypothetical protein [Candidatus Omnitrophota bacterium]
MDQRPQTKYLPCYCPFLKREVWAITTRHMDGTWKIVNCLDKEAVCYQQDCAFTTDGGRWPFQEVGTHNGAS